MLNINTEQFKCTLIKTKIWFRQCLHICATCTQIKDDSTKVNFENIVLNQYLVQIHSFIQHGYKIRTFRYMYTKYKQCMMKLKFQEKHKVFLPFRNSRTRNLASCMECMHLYLPPFTECSRSYLPLNRCKISLAILR